MKDLNFIPEIETTNKFHYKKNPYIPLTKTPEIYNYEYNGAVPGSSIQMMPPSQPPKKNFQSLDTETVETNEIDDRTRDTLNVKLLRRRRSDNEQNATRSDSTNDTSSNSTEEQWKAIHPGPSVIIYSKDDQIMLPTGPDFEQMKDDIKIIHEQPISVNIPSFQVNYWMFYPFSQGKTICTLNLGPLGPIPIPIVPIFNICLGTKKEFGSHVGDWEHMSLFFRGRMEPDVSIIIIII
jgi:hypothetical protein